MNILFDRFSVFKKSNIIENKLNYKHYKNQQNILRIIENTQNGLLSNQEIAIEIENLKRNTIWIAPKEGRSQIYAWVLIFALKNNRNFPNNLEILNKFIIKNFGNNYKIDGILSKKYFREIVNSKEIIRSSSGSNQIYNTLQLREAILKEKQNNHKFKQFESTYENIPGKYVNCNHSIRTSTQLRQAMQNKNFDISKFNYKSALKNLLTNSKVINEQDNNGMTIAHYLASKDCNYKPMLTLLCESNILNLDIQDKDGNTPMMIAANNMDIDEDDSILSILFKSASIQKCNFNILNKEGKNLLHILIINSKLNSLFIFSYLEILCKHNNKIDLNIISHTGSTALFYAINHMKLELANFLLDYGAKPNIYSKNLEKCPIYQANKYIENFRCSTEINKEVAEYYINELAILIHNMKNIIEQHSLNDIKL